MSEVMVLGAGMVGVGSALALQARGHAVTLIDRRAPGEETSYGNAGIIQSEAAEPYAFPRDAATLLKFLSGRSNQLRLSPLPVLRMAAGLLSYWANSTPQRHASASRIYAQLTRRSVDDHGPLIDAAGQGNLIRQAGFFEFYRSAAAFDAQAQYAHRMEAEFGVPFRALDGAAFAREEPSFQTRYAGALHWTGSWTCASPGRLTGAYADLFVARGGRLARGDAASLTQQGSGWTVQSEAGPLSGEHAVICLGPWSPEVLKPFGYRVNMVWKRGYHQHFTGSAPLQRPCVDSEHGLVLSPMTQGLRMATGAALVGQTDPVDRAQLIFGERVMRREIDLGRVVEDQPWYGHRPCLPDMLPLVGKAPRHAGLWLNFGHGHQGFTLGPTTGSLLADAMAGMRSDLIEALSPAGRAAVIR
ncbi:FAD-dependent oxidoreductase [Citreicella sp. C3M06]|uniref:NAD(P)/FAD-dependent oxidoreductase n=1 Tax=Citreicella sp. C3M06 TaxID=2841564 RepID=UPI001C0938B9|nr:FAD-dependent oxidoreductase [Citreicella sp. C3M06]MBU2959950.1 FAD-dependent oxidoreductase [Citreicella sp. C3M06]